MDLKSFAIILYCNCRHGKLYGDIRTFESFRCKIILVVDIDNTYNFMPSG